MPHFRTWTDVNWNWAEDDSSVSLVFGSDDGKNNPKGGPNGLQADMPPGVAVSLLLPAVQAAREAARRDAELTVEVDFIFAEDRGNGASALWELENIVVTSYQIGDSGGDDAAVFEIDATDLRLPDIRDEISTVFDTIFSDSLF